MSSLSATTNFEMNILIVNKNNYIRKSLVPNGKTDVNIKDVEFIFIRKKFSIKMDDFLNFFQKKITFIYIY